MIPPCNNVICYDLYMINTKCTVYIIASSFQRSRHLLTYIIFIFCASHINTTVLVYSLLSYHYIYGGINTTYPHIIDIYLLKTKNNQPTNKTSHQTWGATNPSAEHSIAKNIGSETRKQKIKSSNSGSTSTRESSP